MPGVWQFCHTSEMPQGYTGGGGWELPPGASTGWVLDAGSRETYKIQLGAGRYQIAVPYAETSSPLIAPARVDAAVSREFAIEACWPFS